MHRPYLHYSPSKTKQGQPKASPTGPSYMNDNQIATYLKDLRTNRPSRPGGSRPLHSNTPSDPRDSLPPRAASAMSTYGHRRPPSITPVAERDRSRATSALSNHRPLSPGDSIGSSAGRPLVQEPRTVPIRKTVSPSPVVPHQSPPSPNTGYRESNQRRLEKEEARSLRDALQGVDLNSDDVRIHDAAQDEATELVWMHQNPGVAYKNPNAPYRNPDLQSPGHDEAEKSRVAHTQSLRSPFARRNSRRPVSEIFSRSTGTSGEHQTASDDVHGAKRNSTFRRSLRVNFALPGEEDPSTMSDRRQGLGLSGVSHDSPKGVFRNPTDQIYEEPALSRQRDEDERPDFSKSDSSALRNKPRNALPRGARPFPGRLGSLPFADKLSRFEIHKNPPSQSRNAGYKTNDQPAQKSPAEEERTQPVPTEDEREIRSDDIRAATSKKLKDRSAKLPMPTAVSDRTGRPIVSFDRSWKPTEAETPRKRDSGERRDAASPTPPPAPSAPAIQVSEAPSIPVINLPDDKEPTISEIDSSQNKRNNAPNRPAARGVPNKDAPPRKAIPTSQGRWLSTYSRSGVPTASCESCTLPIAGKIVTAAGSRFHPECFSCDHCQTPLECVAFYQEPEAKRQERLAAEPADSEHHQLRFYCHLDFHELFSPRCKSCKTPIEGEVVVACGAEWHVGHFFCAECGDPFDQDTPFVEKDGFAWCLQCHSRRTAPRCLACKKPVLEDVVISAVGGQWHDSCFNCHECGDGFGPEGRYFVREGEPRRTAKGRIIGGPVQLAICERCEGIRLKASPRS
ncbi:LIM domain protein [Aspergillus campestris IBT 28561]|uniref:LIM domain protein n=1 Tax=Aspergillus campestris (strain IBT 28561) TaxID=1392248 RepID=A0A2I1D5R7_ASPC2|nr:LIM domain protein [Aspergillus campestris IBT 28561]PKY05208.1 LIM domain protein [Aspergillus campestris IBT 28561]